MFNRFVIAAVVLCLSACGGAEPTASKAKRTQTDGIAWFDGRVSEALVRAADRDKPVFLYWGAAWCPPCNQIKSTVFTQPEFIKLTRDFIPVYLDGDTEGAQRWGEQFGTMGYPTLVVLRPDGTEITRVTSGMALDQYPEVLRLARGRQVGVEELLSLALSDPDKLGDDDWQLLAFYGWAADTGEVMGQRDPTTVFGALAAAAPPALDGVQQRFALLGLIERVEAGGELDTPDSIRGREILASALSSPKRLRDNLTELQYHGVDLVVALTSPNTAPRDGLMQALVDAMERAFNDDLLPVKQRLLTTRVLIERHEAIVGGPPPVSLVETVEQRAAWANGEANTPYERQSLIYNAANFLHRIGESEAAKAMFIDEFDRAVAPHYYMSYLSDIEADLGHNEAAIDWARKAYDNASGPATRTQWGIAYVHTLLDLAPDDVNTIAIITAKVIDGLRGNPDAFYQRTRVRMRRLDTALRAWATSDERVRVLSTLRDEMAGLCQDLPPNADGKRVCEDFVNV